MRRLLALACLLTAAPAAAEENGLALEGHARVRYEALDNQFRPNLGGGDQLLSVRTSIHGRWRQDRWTFGAELMDSRAFLSDDGGAISSSEVNALDLAQAYAAYAFDADTSLTLGRMTLDIGARRLIERPNYRNTVNSFTGARFDWKPAANIEALAFYTLPVHRLPDDRESLLDNETAWDQESADLRFWGAFVRIRNIWPDVSGELYLFGLNESDTLGRATRNRNIYTPGARLFRDPQTGAWDYDLEAVAQFGEARASTNPGDLIDRDVAAHYLHAELGYTFDAPLAPRLALIFDHASGDESPADDELNRFDNLYGSRTNDWGPTGIYGPLGPANITAPGAMLEIATTEGVSAHVRYRALFLDEARDSFASTGIRDEFGSSGDEAGHALDARLRIPLPHDARLELGAATLIKGDFLKYAPNANAQGDPFLAYASLEIAF